MNIIQLLSIWYNCGSVCDEKYFYYWKNPVDLISDYSILFVLDFGNYSALVVVSLVISTDKSE